MEYHEATSVIFKHAGFTTGVSDQPGPSLVDELWKLRQGSESMDLSLLIDEIVQCFEVVNHQMNGTLPSESIARETLIPRRLVAAITTMIIVCLETAFELQRQSKDSRLSNTLQTNAWKLVCAWDAILAGDIDDISNHIRLEQIARQI